MGKKGTGMSASKEQVVQVVKRGGDQKEVWTISTSEIPEVYKYLKFLGLPPVINAQSIGYYLRSKYSKRD